MLTADVRDVTTANFGPLIAFVVPGFTALWGLTYLFPFLQPWLAGADGTGPTVGGFLYATLASVAAGLTVSTVRWAIIDTIHHATGIPRPKWDFARLQEHVTAYRLLHEIHYKFYQFNANFLISLTIVGIARRIHVGFADPASLWFDFGLLLLIAILFVGSRDTLRNYYERVTDLLGTENAE